MLVEPLEPRLLLSADLGVLDNGGLNDYFDQVQTQLDNAVFSAPIPLIGTQLAERQSGRIADKISIALQSFTIVPTGASATANDVKTGLSNALGSMIQGGQILDTTNADNSEYRFSLTLAGSESERIDLDLALGADPLINPQLGIEDEVLLSFDWTFDLTFGVFEDNVTADSFFFVDTSFGDELNLDNVMAVLDGGVDGQFDAKGTAGIFGALFQEDVGKPAVEEQIVLGEVITEGEDAVAARGSQFTGRYDIDIVGVGSKTLRNDIADLTVDAVVNGEVDINLDVDGAMIPDFADVSASDRVFNFAVEADLNISQSFVNANTQDALFGGDIEVDYEEVGLDLGTFFTEFVDPFVDGLQIGLSPIKPIVDFLSFPIPVLSEVGAAVGLGKITPIDLGILATAVNPKLTGEQKETALKNLTLAKGTVEFLNVLFDLQPIAEGLPDTAGLLGFAVQLTPSAGQNTGSENENPEPPPPKERKLVRQNASTDLLKDVQNATEKSSAFFSTVAGRIDFPFLHQPDLVRDMLLGDTTPVLANFGLDFAIGYVFEVSIPIIFPVLNAEFQFELKAALDFDAGFDLFGANALTQSLDFSSDTALQQSVDDNIHRLSDGFFFDDHIGEDAPDDLQDGVYDPTEASKGDAPEITLSAKLSAGAKVGPDLLVAQFNAGVRVFFNTSVFFDLNDLPDAQNAAQADYINDVGEGNATEVPSGSFTYDGRVRLGELDLVLNADPFGLFNTSGALYAGLEAFVFASVGFSPFEIIIVDKTFLLASALIYDFNIFQLDDQSVLDGVILNPPTIGAVDSNGTLTLFAGTTADERVNTGPGRQGSDTEINEGFSVSSNGLTDADDPSGGETLVVRFYVLEDGERVERAQQTFDGVKRIVAAGGDGNDSFVVNEDVLADVDFSGGTGHDVLSYAGSGIALLRGNEGNDQLVGGSNDDRLEGGSGDDDLSGRGGDDTLLGGANNDRLDGGLGDDTATGGIGSDTYSWAPGQGIDTIIEDDGLPADTDRITVGGSFSITDGSYAAGSVGSLEAGDNIALSAIDEGGARKVLLTTSDGVAALESIVIDNIENISIAAGGGSDVVTVGDLTGTDVELLAIDLSAADDVGNSTDVDRVIFSGSSVADTLTVEGVFAEFDQTDLGADPEGGVGTTISREIVQLRDTTPGRDSRAFVINSSPDKDVLEVLGLGGGDTLQVSAGSANIDVSELIAVTLRGGDGDDTLITAYDDVTLVGGEDTDTVVVQSDGKVVDGETTLQLFATDLLISRAETDAGQVDERISFSEVEHFRLELEPSTAGNDLRVVSTIAGSVEIVGSTSDDKIALETLAGATTVQLNDGDNTVTVGKDGSVAGIVGDLQVNGGAGDDHVIFDSSAEVSDTLAEIGVVALAGLVAPGALRYNDDVETVELRLGLGADEVQVPDLTRRVIVDLGGGEDRVDATLFGTPNGALNGPGLRAINVEQVNLSNDDNAGSSNWLATANQLRAGTAGVFDPLAPGFYDQVVLETFAADVVNVALGDGPGSDSLLVWDLKTETHVDLRAGDDSVTVGDSRPGAERALVDIEASFVVSGGVGTNTLTIDDAANTLSGIPGFIDAASISGFAMGVGASIDYMGFATLEITLADTEDDVTILDTSIATTLTTDATASGGDDTLTVVNASAGATINLGGASDHATVLGGSDLLIDGGNASGSDTIEFDIRGLTTPTAGAVLGENANGALLTDLGPIGDVAFDDFETARFELGQNSDTITIDHTIAGLTVEVDGAGGDDTVTIRQIGAATQINGESGRDTVVVEVLGAPEDLTDGQQLENLITDLGVDVETLTVDNRTNTVGVDWAIRSGVFSGNGTDLLFTDGADEIFIRAGSSGDSLDFEELAQPVDATIDGPRVVLELGDVVLESAGFGTFANFSNVVDFDDLDTGGFNNVTEYVEDGFRLTSSDSLGDPAVILRNDALSAAAEASDPANVFTLTEENNGGFALYSISLASLDAGTHTITFTGTTLNGETVTRTFDDVEGGSGFVTFDLPDTFTSLKSVSWTAGDPATGGNVLVDNIVAASLVPIGNATAVPGEIPLYRIAADTTFYTFEGFERLRSGSIFVDYDRDNAFDAGVDFNVTPGTSIAQAASYGVIGLTTDNSITQFRFAGDLMIGDGVTVTANGPNALSLLAGNNAFIEDNVTFNVSANGTTGGAGGGGSAGVPGGGGVGAGEGIGGNLQSEVGQGGEGGGAFEEGEEGQSGSRGADGESGRAGIAGQGGGVSGSGVNGGAAGVGGAGGAAGAGGTFGEGGAGGESGEPNHGAGGGGEVGDPGQAGGGGGDGRSGTAGQNNGSDGTLSGGGAGGSGGTGGGGGEGGGAGAGGSGGGAAGEDGFTVFSGNAGSSGASGGEGGNGGDGGAGGSGGAGGGGGGAIEIAAQGRVVMGTNVELLARGGNGQAGSSGASGLAGNSGSEAGGYAEGGESQTSGGDGKSGETGQGGTGGDGGRGGTGGAGGFGGSGAGGAGGTVKLSGTVIDADAAGVRVDTSGGTSLGQTVKIVGDGLNATYYSGAGNFSSGVITTRVESDVHAANGPGAFYPGGPTDNFSVKWTGQIEVTGTQLVKFHLGSDDGSQLLVDGNLVINGYVNQAFTTRSSAALSLAPGVHDITVFYYEAGGFAGIDLSYSRGFNFSGTFITTSVPQMLSADGETGRFIMESNVAGGAPASVDAQNWSTFAGPGDVNPFLSSTASTPLIADLAGGAEIYGLLDDTVTLDDIEAQIVGLVDPLESPDPDALAAVVRLDVGPGDYGVDYTNFDMLLFINLSDVVLDNPMLGVVGSPSNSYSTDLLIGGFATDTLFGGSGGPLDLDGLAPGQIWATLIPDTDPGGVSTSDRINASVAGNILSIDGDLLRDGEVRFITAPRPVVSDAGGLSGLQAVAVSPDGGEIYGISTVDQALIVANAGDLGQRQFFKDGIDGVDGLAGASAVVVSPDGLNVYVSGGDDRRIAIFDRDPASGDLTYVGTNGTAFDFDLYDTMAISADGGTLVVAGDQGGVTFDRAVDGSLSFFSGALGDNIDDVAVSDDGAKVYAVNAIVDTLTVSERGSFGSATVQQTIDLGALSVAGAGPIALAEASAVALSQDNAFVYVTGTDGVLAVFARDAATGDLTIKQVLVDGVNGIRGLEGANDVVGSADNAFVYVTGGSGRSLAVFERNATSGELQFAQALRGRTGLEAPAGLAAAADGNVYVAAETGLGLGNGGVASFSRAVFTGETVPLVVSHEAVEALSLTFGVGDDVIRQINAATVDVLDIDAGDGFNTADLLNVGAETTVSSGIGDDTITVRSDTDGAVMVSVDSGSGDDSVVVRELAAGNTLSINLGDDADEVQIAGEKLPATASISVNGGNGNDTLRFSAGGMPINPSAPVTPDGTIKVDDAAFGTVAYQSIEAVPGFDPSEAEVGGPYVVAEGGTLTLAGIATAATNTSIVSTRWDLNGDGVFGDASGEAPVLSWTELVALGIDDGDKSFEITIEVTDSAGNVTSDTGQLSVTNTDPQISSSGATSAIVGVPYVLNFSATDPGDDTISGWEVDWGDGSPRELFASDAISASHVYLTSGTFTPVVVATDEDGSGSFVGDPATTPYTAAGPTVTVVPPVPTITSVGTANELQISEGEGVTLRALVAGTPTTFTWDVDGDGVFGDETTIGLVSGTDLTLSAADLVALGRDDGNADYGVSVQVAFGDGTGGLGIDTSIGSADLTVLNAAPTAQLTNSTQVPGSPVNEGDSVTVSFVNQDDPSSADAAAGFTYSYDFDNDGVFEIVDSTQATVVAPGDLVNDAGTRTVRAVITDKDGGSFEAFTGVRVAEVAPTLSVIGADDATEGAAYALELSASDPGNDAISKWTVNWGDGTPDAVVNAETASLSHVFADDGVRIVTVTAQDEDGIYVTSKAVTVANVNPTIAIAGPASLDEGDGFVLTLEADDAGADTISTWQINWGDGTSDTVPGSATTASHIYADDSVAQPGGVFEIVATATDEDGGYVTTLNVRVDDVAPSTVLGGTGTPEALLAGPASTDPATIAVNEGSNFTLSIDAPTDPGDDTVTEYTIDWGDGVVQSVAAAEADASGFVPTLNVNHVYSDGAVQYTIAVTLIDDEGNSFANATTLDVDVRNVAPVLALAGNSSVNEGDVYTLTLGAPSDPGDDTVTAFDVDWGDGSAVERFTSAGEVTHIYRNAVGSEDKTISVSLVDEDGSYADVASKVVQVNEVPPALSIAGAGTSLEGAAYTLTLGDLVDPGSDSGVIAVTEYVVDWGDGNVESFTTAGDVEHTFADGLFNNQVSVDVVTAGGTFVDAAQLSVQVTNAAPTLGAVSIDVAPLPDLNNDNVVDFVDIAIVASSFFGDTSSSPLIAAADLNGDGVVDYDDINIVLGAYGQVVAPPADDDVGVGAFAAGGTAYIEGTFSDMGVNDTHEALIDWGDGTTTVASLTQGNGEGSFFGRHTYTEAGVFKVTVTVADSDADADAVQTIAYVSGVAVHDGVLHIVGTEGDDNISVTRNAADPTRIDVSANFVPGGTQTFDLAGISSAVVFAGDGMDNVTVADDVVLPFLISGGDGNDTLTAGGGSTVLLGGSGQDTLTGGAQADLLIGGDDTDELNGAGGNDLLAGGADNDAVNGGAGDGDIAFFNGNEVDYSVSGDATSTSVTTLDAQLDGDDTLLGVEDILFEDSTDSSSPLTTNPWADDLVTRLKGPAKDVDADDAVWLLFE